MSEVSSENRDRHGDGGIMLSALPDRLIPSVEVLARLGISHPTLNRLVKAGELPRGIYILAKLLWRLSNIEKFIETRKRQAFLGEPGAPALAAIAAARTAPRGPHKKPRPRKRFDGAAASGAKTA
jgi:predicted DNA-binding transcriptional regulator AlpA